MELGEKLKQARLEAGLSQRALCGEEITRNMLSQIEHGTARPSMATLAYLAGQLGRPISWFLEEEGNVSVNTGCIRDGWAAFEQGDYAACAESLADYKAPDALLDREMHLLTWLNLMAQGEKAAGQGKKGLVRRLTAQAEAEEHHLPWLPELKTRRAVLLARIDDPVPEALLPDVDGALLLRADSALKRGNWEAAARYLDAVNDRDNPRWSLLRGRAAAGLKQYSEAIPYLQAAEKAFPRAVIPLLEEAYRELGDFRNAYVYACKRR